jgi:hypothetical protein
MAAGAARRPPQLVASPNPRLKPQEMSFSAESSVMPGAVIPATGRAVKKSYNTISENRGGRAKLPTAWAVPLLLPHPRTHDDQLNRASRNIHAIILRRAAPAVPSALASGIDISANQVGASRRADVSPPLSHLTAGLSHDELWLAAVAWGHRILFVAVFNRVAPKP